MRAEALARSAGRLGAALLAGRDGFVARHQRVLAAARAGEAA